MAVLAPRHPKGGARPCRCLSPAGAPQPAATPAPARAFGTCLPNLAQAKHSDSVSDSKVHTRSTLAPSVRPPYADPQGSHLSSPS